MGVAIFFLLALIVAGAIAYPLLPGRARTQVAPTLTDGEIEQAVRNLRRTRSGAEQHCPACGRAFQPGDRFCVGCGQSLPQADSAGPVCPSCGAALHSQDLFCAKCGHRLPAGEAA